MEIIYISYEDENGKSKVEYKMKSPINEEKRYTFNRDKNLDIRTDIFAKIEKEGHNEAWKSDFKIQSAQRRAQLELIFGLAKIVIESKASSNSYSFFQQAQNSDSEAGSRYCLVM